MKRIASVVVVLVLASRGSEAASTWHVKADAAAGGDGSRSRPFATLEQVEGASQPGDTIRVLPSTRPLDRGIQLKNNQRLIGLGDPVTKGASNATLRVKNTRFTGFGGAVGVLNTNNIETLNVLVENSSMSDLKQTGTASPIAAVTVTHPADKTIGTAIIDLGGGSLGSRGRNRFVNNAGLDVVVSNANAATAPIRVEASRNYWGGARRSVRPRHQPTCR